MNATTHTEPAGQRTPSRETSKILGECRDLAVSRLTISFAQMMDRVGELLMDRANRSDVREEQQLYLDARHALKGERPALMAEFEKQLRRSINERIAGKATEKADFSKADTANLTLVETSSMDESVLTGNITRIVENLSHDELLTLNRGLGHLLGRPDLSTDANPLSPAAIVDAFAEALKSVKTDRRIKFQILKELNQAPMGDISVVYAELNQHLKKLNVMPAASRPTIINRGSSADRDAARAEAAKAKAQAPPPEMDVMAMFKRMYGSATPSSAPQVPPQGLAGAMGAAIGAAMSAAAASDFPQIQAPGQGGYAFAPMAPTPSGYVPGAPIISSQDLHEGLTRLQAGQTSFDVGGAAVAFSGIPQGMHNVLRDLQESPLGKKANQIESMTIEMVAMLFDFIFDTKDLPDGIKALLARMQIPVLKAAMLDGAFFAKKTHPSRLLVNALAQAGLGWSPVMGQDDPLYKKISEIVHNILDHFSDDLAIFDEQREVLEAFLAEEEKAAEANIQSTAEEINERDRHQISTVVAKAEIERRIDEYPVPNFLATFLRQNWEGTLAHVHMHDGEDSESWGSAVTTLEDLVWSIQPKKSPEDRRHLVALLPSLLKRLSAGMHSQGWPPAERESFMANLVEAHAAAVKPSFAAVRSPTAAVAEAAKVQAEMAKAAGDDMLAAKAEALAEAMTDAVPEPAEPEREVLDDEYLEIARSLERGMWIEFEADDGQLAFAKLAWVSPLRGTYLFTNRQGQKALSMTAEDLAERFRIDSARLVEAEPLIDRAFSSMMSQMEESSRLRQQIEWRVGMGIGALIIGDEILSGKRQDKHFPHFVATLASRGITADFVHYLGDDRVRLTTLLRDSFSRGDTLFSFGGIGATPDDHTRQAAAAALSLPLAPHPDAVAEIVARFGDEAYPHRVLMAEFPEGARIIPNPVNRVAGFAIHGHHFLPGFPQMAWPMLDWVLATWYPGLRNVPPEERAIVVYGAGESQLLPLMEDNVARFPTLKLFSLPSFMPDGGRRIELGVKGDPSIVEAGIAHLRDGVDAAGFRWEPAEEIASRP